MRAAEDFSFLPDSKIAPPDLYQLLSHSTQWKAGMQRSTAYPDGTRQVHTYEEMTAEKRPQDPLRDGTGLEFDFLEHHGFDVCPEAIELRDAEGRSCVYAVNVPFREARDRPQDEHMNRSGLRVETLAHGGAYPDNMPQALRVTDAKGRSALYSAISVDGQIVDSKGFRLSPAHDNPELPQTESPALDADEANEHQQEVAEPVTPDQSRN